MKGGDSYGADIGAAMHPVTMAFARPTLERDFQRHLSQTNLLKVRGGLALLIVSTLAGALTDRVFVPNLTPTLFLLRCTYMAPLLGIALGCTWWSFAARRLADLVAITLVFMVLGFVLPIYLLFTPEQVVDYMGAWILAVVSCHALLGLGFWRASAITALSLACAHAVVLYDGIDDPHGRFQLVILHVANVTCMVGSYTAERRDRRLFVRERDLVAERQRSEELLLNILPASIAARLKATPGTIADGRDDVGVLFCDIVGFTSMSQRMAPAEVVRRLDAIFTAFDDLAARHGVEKIKTIGDAYMVVSGLPDPVSRPVHRLAEMALDMRDAVAALAADLDEPLSVRLGIHVGPVIAGVIGRKKFSYDLWGDTVNTASRMESHGVPGAIHVSSSVQERIADAYALQARGVLDIKGKGPMQTWMLTGRLIAAS